MVFEGEEEVKGCCTSLLLLEDDSTKDVLSPPLSSIDSRLNAFDLTLPSPPAILSTPPGKRSEEDLPRNEGLLKLN